MKSPKMTKAEKRAARHRARLAVLGEAANKSKTTSIQQDQALENSRAKDNPTSYWNHTTLSLVSPMRMHGDKTTTALRGGSDEEHSRMQQQYHPQPSSTKKKLKHKEKRELRERARRAMEESSRDKIATTHVQKVVLSSPTHDSWLTKPFFSPMMDPPKSPQCETTKQAWTCKKLEKDEKRNLRERARRAIMEGRIENTNDYAEEYGVEDTHGDMEMTTGQGEVYKRKDSKKLRQRNADHANNNNNNIKPMWKQLISCRSTLPCAVVFLAMMASYLGPGPLLFLMEMAVICTKIVASAARLICLILLYVIGILERYFLTHLNNHTTTQLPLWVYNATQQKALAG